MPIHVTVFMSKMNGDVAKDFAQLKIHSFLRVYTHTHTHTYLHTQMYFVFKKKMVVSQLKCSHTLRDMRL